MKKLILAALVLGATQAAMASDGTVTFAGKIVENTCVVNSNSKSLNVTLPTVNKSSFTAPNQSAGLTLFNIQLDSCSNQKVRAYFEPTPGKVNYDTGKVINTDGTTGSSIEIELLDSDGAGVLQLSENEPNQNSKYQTITDSNNKLRYFARYHSKTATVAAGSVTGSVDYTISYE